MKIFQKCFRFNTSLNKIGKYVRLVFKISDSDGRVKFTYKVQIEDRFVKTRMIDRVFN